jgi:undecaprenyl-diphosphatase
VADAGSAFPSNHAFSSLALYGMLTYLAGRGLRSAAARGSLYASLGVLVLAVGLGRLYLGAHWLSDVAGGYALGAIWLTALVTAAEVHRRSSEAPPIPSRHRNLAPLTVAVALLAAWGVVTAWQMPRDLSRRSETTPRRSIPAAAVVEEVRSLAAWPVETLLGEPRGAFGLALVGPEPVVRDAARAAGWGIAEPLQPGSLLPRLLRAFRGESDPLAPPYPFFWQARPQDLALTRPADRGRWVVRLWRSGITVVGIGDIWVAWLRFEPPPSRFLGIPLPALGSGAEAPWPALRDALAATGRLRPFPSGPGPAVLFAPSPFPEPR